jgi:phospholipase C
MTVALRTMARRSWRQLMGGAAACSVALAGCSDKGGGDGIVQTEEQAQARRAACEFQPGTSAKETLASSWPTGSKLPIDHIVWIMQENRSFDHYYSKLTHGGVDVMSMDATNPDADGKPVKVHHLAEYCVDDVHHSWGAVHEQINGGKMDGFVTTNDPDGARAMGYYDEGDLPFYYALARTFAISDRHFCSLPGPTWPNRMFFFAGTSFGLTVNTVPPDQDENGEPHRNVMAALSQKGVDWKVYAQGVATPIMFASTFAENQQRFVKVEDFFADAAAGKLPAFSIVEAKFSGDGISADEHAPGMMQIGQKFVANVVNSLMKSPNWNKSALFITYDEHGGFYDHVPPPKACKPDDRAPYKYVDGEMVTVDGAFDQLGPRVPLLVVSPYAKRGHVSHRVTDHTSILRFVEARFDLPAMSARDANAEPPYDMFDFEHPNFDTPSLPAAEVNEAEKTRCEQAFPPKGNLPY